MLDKNRKIIIVVGIISIALLSFLATLDIFYGKRTKNTHNEGVKEIDFSKQEVQELASNMINDAGVYKITGEIKNTIRIDASKKDVKLILSDVSISASSGPAIYVESADTVYIELVGDNTIKSNTNEELDGAIYSKSDLCLVGDGKLTITSNLDGIVGKDDLQINAGNYTINSTGKGIMGKDSLTIKDGTYNITSKDDSIHTNGNLYITGGNINIASDDDGIHADENVNIKNAIINITKSYEGIEGLNITVDSGNISVVSTDDGFNAAGGDGSSQGRPGSHEYANTTNSSININGGTIHVNAQGDGIDSNGNIIITGGEVYVDGPTNPGNGPMDYGDFGKYKFEITGGILIAVGSSSMAVAPTDASITSVLINLPNSYSGTFALGDVAYKPSKTYSSILICSNLLSQGNTYDLKINGNTVTTVTLNNMITTSGTTGRNGGPGGGDHGGGPNRGW